MSELKTRQGGFALTAVAFRLKFYSMRVPTTCVDRSKPCTPANDIGSINDLQKNQKVLLNINVLLTNYAPVNARQARRLQREN